MNAERVFEFTLDATSGSARAGTLTLPHGTVETPLFMPVGTQGTVRALSPNDLRAAGATMVLANTYHLHVRPGEHVVEQLGRLHRFMGWDRPLLTDSGGFQVFSLEGFRRVDEAGVEFRATSTAAAARSRPSAPRRSSGRWAPMSRWRSTTWCREGRTNRPRGTPWSARCDGWSGARDGTMS